MAISLRLKIIIIWGEGREGYCHESTKQMEENNDLEKKRKRKKKLHRIWLFLRLEFSKLKAPQMSGKITSGRRI